MDQVITFVGRGAELPAAVDEAQRAANAWLAQHGMAIGTIYSATGQSLWQESERTWHHVIMLTLEVRGATTPLVEEQKNEEPRTKNLEPKGKRKRT